MRHSYETIFKDFFLWDILLRHFHVTFWWYILMRDLMRHFYQNILMKPFDAKFWGAILMIFFDQTFWWDFLMRLISKRFFSWDFFLFFDKTFHASLFETFRGYIWGDIWWVIFIRHFDDQLWPLMAFDMVRMFKGWPYESFDSTQSSFANFHINRFHHNWFYIFNKNLFLDLKLYWIPDILLAIMRFIFFSSFLCNCPSAPII